VPVEDLRELRFENPRIHHLGFRSDRRELAVPGQQPAILLARDAGELGILGFGPEVETVVAAETEPTGERPEHRVAEEAGFRRAVNHGDPRIPRSGTNRRDETEREREREKEREREREKGGAGTAKEE